jgi:hypothetical protein
MRNLALIILVFVFCLGAKAQHSNAEKRAFIRGFQAGGWWMGNKLMGPVRGTPIKANDAWYVEWGSFYEKELKPMLDN